MIRAFFKSQRQFWFGSSRTASATPRMSLATDHWRFRLLWIAVAAVFLAILLRAFYVQVVNHHFLQAKADAMMLRVDTLPAYRGIITDRNGVPLAVSTPLASLWLDTKEYFEHDIEAKMLQTELANRLLQKQQDEQKQGFFSEKPAPVPQQALYSPELKRLIAAMGIKDEVSEKWQKDIQAMTPAQLKYRLKLISKANAKIDDLANAVGIDPIELKQKMINKPSSRFLVLKRFMPPKVAQVVLDRKFQSVYKKVEYQRFYPQSQPNAQLLGLTNSRDQGIEGLELLLNDRLAGRDGKMRIMRDKRGNRIKDVELIEPALPGEDIQLSIDSRLEYIMYRELAAAGIANNARSATAVALDVNTGEILAMSSWPSFNSNDSKTGMNNKDAMRNRPAIDMFEPGSTMKPLTVAAALESGKYTTHTLINTSPGSLVVGNHRIRDHHNNGMIDLKTLIVKSSNVASAKIALSLPNNTLPTFYQRLGFGKRTALGFPGESPGLILPPNLWNTAEVATMSYGYAINVTAVQLAQSYGVLASGGLLRPVTIFKQNEPVAGTRVLDESIAKNVVRMMQGVTERGGTALQAAIPGYHVAGKTGTAHKLRPDGKGYSPNDYRALFVGMAPASRPQIVLAVVVENPVGQYYGGLVSAPIFAKIMQESLRLRSVPLDKSLEPDPAEKKKS